MRFEYRAVIPERADTVGVSKSSVSRQMIGGRLLASPTFGFSRSYADGDGFLPTVTTNTKTLLFGRCAIRQRCGPEVIAQ